MSSYSPYAVSDTAPPKWSPGEELAAAGFVAVVFFLFLDINLSIYRIFKKKQGLYYWSMLLGTSGCAIDGIGACIAFFMTSFNPSLWWLKITLLLVGWSIFVPAQLLVLYSRLHLVNRSRQVQRWVLIMIVCTSVAIIVPTWIIDYPAWNPQTSSIWSFREAVIDRCSQILYTIVEGILSGIYIYSLVQLLRLKSSVRQRRVMLDLVYVNIIVVALDIVTVVLIFTNQLGIFHPTQAFSYTLKFKLEFIVLNQLMAVAAKGVRYDTFAERRYHEPSTTINSSSSGGGLLKEKPSNLLSHASDPHSEKDLPKIPPVTTPSRSLSHRSSPSDSKPATLEMEVGPLFGNQEGSVTDAHYQHAPPPPTFHIPHHPFKRGQHEGSIKAKIKKHTRTKGKHQELEEDGEEEIGVHMWENRGHLVMEVPWFQTEGRQGKA